MLKAFSMTDIGKIRKMNQDFVYACARPVGQLPNLFIAADGMGGHNAGDYASKCAVQTIVDKIAQDKSTEPVRIIKNAVETANSKVHQEAENSSSLAGMGTTVVVASCVDNTLVVANVGDSRLYVINEEIKQITRDHSLVEEMVRLGGIAKEDARNHPDKNIITRAVGVSRTVNIDFFTVVLEKGDIILMCSDGLTNMLEDRQILEIVREPRLLCDRAHELVRAANNNGGKDNIAVILVEPFAEDLP